MVIFKFIRVITEKVRIFRVPQAVQNRASRPQFETYIKYSKVDDEEKEVMSGFNGSFLRILVGGNQKFKNLFKKAFFMETLF